MEKKMGKVTEVITLMNAGDRMDVNRGYMPENSIRQVTVDSVVDTGAWTLVINEELQQKLGLAVEGTRRTRFANGAATECSITEPVRINWKDRFCNCSAVVIPGSEQTLLGAIPLEDMDLMVDPVNQRLVGVHGDEIVSMVL
jgi:clan AA aspartic protease